MEPGYANNPHILKWWTPEHDELLARRIGEHQWHFYWGITDEILTITPPETVESWKAEDPLCNTWAWYNILMNFAGARADRLGLTDAIREPKWKTCPLCDQRFVEDSLLVPLTDRLGFDHLDYCAPCLAVRLRKSRRAKADTSQPGFERTSPRDQEGIHPKFIASWSNENATKQLEGGGHRLVPTKLLFR